MPTVSFDHVSKRFGDVRVVEDFDLDVADGELLVLVGGSRGERICRRFCWVSK